MPANPILICAPTDDLRAAARDAARRSAGYVTTSVTTPAAAVAALRDGSFDLVMAEGLAVSRRHRPHPDRGADADAGPGGRAGR